METPTPSPAAPAQPETITATRDAANRGDFASFDKAHQAARAGAPLPEVTAPEPPPASDKPAAAAPAAPASDAPALSRKEREQQDANDRVRRAVDLATADLRAEIDRLKAAAPRSEPPVTEAAPPKDTAEWKEYAALPDAPKLEDFDSVSDHTAAMSFFIAKAMLTKERQAEQTRASAAGREQALQEKASQYTDRLRKAKEADPEILTKIPPEVRGATPLSGCVKNQAGQLVDPKTSQPVTFANVVVEAGFHSENPAALYTHLHANRGEQDRIAALPSAEWLPALIRLDGRLSAAEKPAVPSAPAPSAPAPSIITAAPPPPPILSSAGTTADPKAAAISRGDFAAFDKLEMQEKRARHAHA